MSGRGVSFAVLVVLCALGAARAQPALFEPERDYYKAKGVGVSVKWDVPASAVQEGRDLAVTLVISRVQNPTEVVRPDLGKLPAFAERFEVAKAAPPPAINGNEVRFAYTLRPRSRTVDKVPALDFYYFNPAAAPGTSQFRLTRADSVPVRVSAPPPKPALPMSEPDHLFAVPAVPSESAFEPCLWAWGAAALFGPLAAFAWFLAWRRVFPDAARRARLRRTRAARRAIDGVRRAARTADPPAAIAAAVLSYLRDRFPLPESAVTPSELEAALRAAEVPEARAREAADVFRACDRARFAPPNDSGLSLAADAEAAVVRLETGA
jgi:hypothetical protein